MDETVVATDVGRTYGETVALAGVSLTVDAGEVFALVGPNGAGKTTFVRALTGTTDAEGEVAVLGQPPGDVDRSRLGLLPQSFDPPERLTARELLEYYGGLYDESRDVDAVLEDVGMRGDADTWYENLSGGQQRRTCVGIALVNDPDVLFLDEPTTGIDPAGRRALWELIEALAAGGTTVFLTTHDMAEAHRLADRVGLLADGELVAVDDPDALVAAHGGDSRLVVTTGEGGVEGDDDGAALPADAESALDYPVERTDGGLVVHGVDPEDIGGVVDALAAAGIDYDALTWKEPDLEDVYLELAGETDRSSAQTAPPPGAGDRHAADAERGVDG